MIRNVVAHLKRLWRRGGQEREGNVPAAPKPPPKAMRNVDDPFLKDNPIHVSQGSAFDITEFYDVNESAWRGDLTCEDAWKAYRLIQPGEKAHERLQHDDPGMAMRDLPLPPWMRAGNRLMHLPHRW